MSTSSPDFPHQYRAVSLPLLPQPPCQDILDSLVLVREQCPPAAQYGPQMLELMTIFYTRSGRATAVVNGREFKHTPGSILAVSGGSTLHEIMEAQAPWQVDYLAISGSWVHPVEESLRARGSGAVQLQPAPANLRSCFASLFDVGLAQPEGWRWRIVSECAQLLGALLSYRDPGDETSLLQQIETRLTAFPGHDWSVGEIARQLQLSTRQLDFRFRAATGEPIGRWLRRRRIESAAGLLAQGLSVSATSAMLGYANPFHFSRVFKEIVGMSPSTYRLQATASLQNLRRD